MRAIDTLSNVAGLYALTRDGRLGVFGEEKKLAPLDELSQAFAEHIQQLLTLYPADPDGSGFRLGLIYRASERRPWGADTFALEETVVREVYPVSGPPNQELTTFQKKNREKSIYRCVELLLEYRHERIPEEPVYCPVLFDRGTTLDQYPVALGYGGSPDERIPVIEVLNLMASIPLGRRNTSAILALMQTAHQRLVKKDMRDDRFAVVGGSPASPFKATAPTGFFGVDKRAERQLTIAAGEVRQRLELADKAQAAHRVEQVEKWANPRQAIQALRLQAFTQFKHLDPDRLSLLAEKAQIYSAPMGTRLLNRGMSDPWNMYLLEGKVSLEPADGASLYIEGGSEKAANPVSFLKPRKYTVTAVTTVSFLWVHDAVLEAVLATSATDTRLAPTLKQP